MTRVLLSGKARKHLLSLKQKKQKDRLFKALKEIESSPLHARNVTSLSGVPNGYRKRVGRFRILYTFHAEEDLVRIWILDMEKDTQKDYDRWIGYIMENL